MRVLFLFAVLAGLSVGKTLVLMVDNANGSARQGYTFVFVNYDRFRCEPPSVVQTTTYSKKIIHTVVVPRRADQSFEVREAAPGEAANVVFIDRDETRFTKTAFISEAEPLDFCSKVNRYSDRVVFAAEGMQQPIMINGIVYQFDRVPFMLFNDSDAEEFFVKMHGDSVWIATSPLHLVGKPGQTYSRASELPAHHGFGRFAALSPATPVVDRRALQRLAGRGQRLAFLVEEYRAAEWRLRIREETNGGFYAYVTDEEGAVLFELRAPQLGAEVPFALYLNDFLVQHGVFRSASDEFMEDPGFSLNITCPLAFTATETELKDGQELFLLKAYCRDPHRLV